MVYTAGNINTYTRNTGVKCADNISIPPDDTTSKMHTTPLMPIWHAEEYWLEVHVVAILHWTLHSFDHNILLVDSVINKLIRQFTPVLALQYDPLGVDVPLNFDITHLI